MSYKILIEKDAEKDIDDIRESRMFQRMTSTGYTVSYTNKTTGLKLSVFAPTERAAKLLVCEALADKSLTAISLKAAK
jgi:hypothetical protein